MTPPQHPPIRGTHVCLDFSDCDVEKLNDKEYLVDLITTGAKDAGASVLSVQSHAFDPQGVTALVMIAESHISIHTWPEHAFAAADVFTCGPSMDTEKICALLHTGIGAGRVVKTVVSRGLDTLSGDTEHGIVKA